MRTPIVSFRFVPFKLDSTGREAVASRAQTQQQQQQYIKLGNWPWNFLMMPLTRRGVPFPPPPPFPSLFRVPFSFLLCPAQLNINFESTTSTTTTNWANLIPPPPYSHFCCSCKNHGLNDPSCFFTARVQTTFYYFMLPLSFGRSVGRLLLVLRL